MIVGYILDHILGLALSALVLLLASRKHPRLAHVSRTGLESFAYCASFFAFSIELAAIVVLVREDFGIHTSGMGDYTVRITQAVSMVILLPLVYPILTFIVTPLSSSLLAGIPDNQEDAAPDDDKDSTRFSLFVLCWALAFYPFYSKMNAAFGPSKIQKHHASGHSVITPKQWKVIEGICFRNTKQITYTETNLMTAFVMLAYIPLSLFVLGRIFWHGVEKNHNGSTLHKKLQTMSRRVPSGVTNALPVVVFGSIPLIACGLLWSIIRAQRTQMQLTASYGGIDSDNYWTFGQIVAVTIFAPVVVECWSSWGALRKGRIQVLTCMPIESPKMQHQKTLESVDPS